MRTLHVVVFVSLTLLVPRWSGAQDLDRQGSGAGAGAGSSSGGGTGAATAATVALGQESSRSVARAAAAEPPPGRWVRALTNVQVELTISDQTGSGPPEKKTVSMVASSGSWGRIRSAQMVRDSGRDQVIDLNVDARPMVSVDGPIQLELTVVYSPPGATTGDVPRVRPTGVNQSLTVILNSGKPLVISQAADPVGDRKIIVEAKATVLK